MKRFLLTILLAISVSVSNISFAQNTDYVFEIGYTTTTVRSFAGRYDHSPGFFMRYGTACTPEVWSGVGPAELSFYMDTRKISDRSSCGFYGFKLGRRMSRYVSGGFVFDSGVSMFGRASNKYLNYDDSEYQYIASVVNDYYPPSIYRNRIWGLGLYSKFKYPLGFPGSDISTIAPFVSVQIVSNGNNTISFGLAICMFDGYRRK